MHGTNTQEDLLGEELKLRRDNMISNTAQVNTFTQGLNMD
jgi:hypothetical protein